ncbi:MAG: hypothetical protein QOJ93_1254 [Actinomycetota bacterium]|nr:hypothetical protein [Actinomycetota bacterium]
MPPIKDVVDEGVLSEEDLDRLAGLFLSGDTIRFRKSTGRGTTQLHVRTRLHRWAAGHLLRRGPEDFSSLLERARSTKAAMAAAMVKDVPIGDPVLLGEEPEAVGMLDSISALDPGEAAVLLALGLVWPFGSVRRHALEILTAQGDVQEAARLAASDPDAKVRRWRPRGSTSPAEPANDGGPQDSLFDGGIGGAVGHRRTVRVDGVRLT